MPSSTVTLLINGNAHSNWERYSIDSNLMIAADAFDVSLSQNRAALPGYLREGAGVLVQIDEQTVMTGFVDDVDDGITRTDTPLAIRGRDKVGQLVDCSAPIFSSRQIALDEVVAKVVAAFGINKVRIASKKQKFERVSVEPGETAWDMLERAAEANGLFPWLDPDGTLVVGGADYSQPIAAHLYLETDGSGGNIETVNRTRTINGRYSEVTILGQAHGTETEDGEPSILGKAIDASLGLWRPKIMLDSEAQDRGMALARARKLLADGRLEGYTLRVVVSGHYTDSGKLWKPGMRVQVAVERMGIDAVHFLMGRTFKRDRMTGTTTELLLKEDGVWTIDAMPHSKKHPRGKIKTKQGQELEIIDLTQ